MGLNDFVSRRYPAYGARFLPSSIDPTVSGGTTPLPDNFLRPIKGFADIQLIETGGNSNYHSLQTSLTKRYAQGFQFTAAYALSHALDDVSDVFDVGGAFALPQDDRNFAAERASANFDIRHRFVFSLVSNVPGLHRLNDKRGAAGWLFGNWQFSALTTYQTGQPYTVNTSYDVNLDGNLTDRINTLEGLRHKKMPILSFQHHPEAAPGPRDAQYLFNYFLKMMDEKKAVAAR